MKFRTFIASLKYSLVISLFGLLGLLFPDLSLAFEGGNGSEGSPYQIATCTQLQSISSTSLTAHYELIQNIDCSATNTWNSGAGFVPINNFNGTLDGNNRVITGLYINRPSTTGVGLFGENTSSHSPTIQNLRMEQATIIGNSRVGGIAGRLYGTVTNSSFSGDVTGNGDQIGGLIGQPFNATIDQVLAVGTVTGSGTASTRDIGGLTGRASGTTNIGVAYTRSTVSGGQYVGGIMGSSSTTVSSFSQMYSASTLTDAVTSSGAIVGIIENSGDTFSSIYFDNTLASTSFGTNTMGVNTSGMVGLTTANMQGEAAVTNMVGFNFDDIWVAVTVPDDDYPVFEWQSGSLVEVSGVVTHALTGSVISGLQVQAVPDDNNFGTVSATTNAEGEYSFFLYTSPMYTISATSTFDGFEVSDSETISSGITTEVDLALGHQYTGEGTAESPYQISSAVDLQQIRYYLDAYYSLEEDVDMSGASSWFSSAGFQPIGSLGDPFTGSLDGQGNTVSNLVIDRDSLEYTGLFTHLQDATVENLFLDNLTVDGGSAAGGAGGLAGHVSDSTIHRVGVGSSSGGADNFGEVKSAGRAGGLVGLATGSETNITESYSEAEVESDVVAGGLVGRVQDQASVANSYAAGTVNAPTAGGLVGSLDTASITKTHAVGQINQGVNQSITEANVGGLVGEVNSATISHSFWNSETTGQSQSAGTGAQARNSAQMEDTATFTTQIDPNDWDFVSIWGIFDTDYPVLQAFNDINNGEFRISNYGAGQTTSNHWYKGFRFRVSQLTVVTHLVGGGSSGDFEIGIYNMVMNGDRVRPASVVASVTASDSTAEQEIELDSPVILYPNTDYVLAQGRSSGAGQHYVISSLNVQEMIAASPRISFWQPDSDNAFRWDDGGSVDYIVDRDHLDSDGSIPLIGIVYESHVNLPSAQTAVATHTANQVSLGAEITNTGNGQTSLFLELSQDSDFSDSSLFALGEFNDVADGTYNFTNPVSGTTYYYRGVAINETGRTNGPTLSFRAFSASYDAGENGSISGVANQIVLDGSDTSEVTAVANEGFTFLNWSDGVTTATRQDESVTEALSVTANFIPNPILSEIENDVSIQEEQTPTGNNKATITWQTNSETSSQVFYGLNSSPNFETPETNTDDRVTSHEVELQDLQPCARYYYQVRSEDELGAVAESQVATLITTGCEFSQVVAGSESLFTTAGGELDYTHGITNMRLSVPAGSISSDATFQINVLENNDLPSLPSGKVLGSNTLIRMLALSNSNQLISSFDVPVEFEMSYSSTFSDKVNLSSLDLYKFSQGEWIKQNCNVSTQNQRVSCNLSSFSVYALLGDPADTKSKTSKPLDQCVDIRPEGVPNLFQITTTTSTAQVSFTPVGDATDYFISYATNPTALEHGFLYTGTSYGVQQADIVDLLPNTKYYFMVRADNACQPGNWSQIVTAVTLRGASPLFSSLVSQDRMQIDSLTVETPEEPAVEEELDDTSETEGLLHDVLIRVEDQGVPIGGVLVELHSDPKSGVTDENGEVFFEGVEPGEHTLKLAYADYNTEQKLVVDGDSREFAVSVNVTFEQSSGLLTTTQWLMLLLLIVVLTSVVVYKAARRS